MNADRLGLTADKYQSIKEKMVGTNDENIGLGEYVLQTVTFTNLSKLTQENQELKLRINNGVITDDKVKLVSIIRNINLSDNDSSNESVKEEKDKTAEINNIISVKGVMTPSNSKSYSEYTIKIKEIQGRETLKLTYLVKITSENMENVQDGQGTDKAWHFIQKAYDKVTNIQLAQKDVPMLRDYGENFVGNYGSTKDKHYITYGNVNPAYLGTKVTAENEPVNSDDNDGVTFDEVKPDAKNQAEIGNIIYSDMRNSIKVNATHDGYIALWLSDENNTWGIKLNKPKDENSQTEPEDTNIYEVKANQDNHISFIVPQLKATNGETRVLRVKYAVHKKDLEKPEQTALTGEVEDYKVIIQTGMDVMFGDGKVENAKYTPLDLGVPCEEHSDKSLGDRDGYFAPNEIIEHTITVKNFVNDVQKDKEIIFKSNLNTLVKGEYNGKDFEIITTGTGEIESITPIMDSKIIEANQYLIKLKTVKPKSDFTFKVKFRVTGEDFKDGKSYIQDKLVYDKVDPNIELPKETAKEENLNHRVSVELMKQDYGDNFVGSYDATTDARHYITTRGKEQSSSHPAILGNIITEEDGPVNSDDNDGVIFDKKVVGDKDVNIIYDNLTNKITVSVTHKGYINAWLSKGNTANDKWEDSIPIQLRTDVNAISEVANKNNPIEIEQGTTDIAFDLKDVLKNIGTSEERILRIRYAVNQNEIKEPIGMASTGEVEDYKVLVEKGTEVKFGEDKEKAGYKPVDLGVTYKAENKDVTLGAKDGYYALDEIIEHTITVYNKSNHHQEYQDIVFNTNICGEFIEFVDGYKEYAEMFSKQEAGLDGLTNYVIRVKDIKATTKDEVGYRTIKARFKVTKENLDKDYKFYIKDRVVTIDEESLPEYTEFDKNNQVSLVKMESDYGEAGEGFIEIDSEDVARHYIISKENGSKPAYLGEKISKEDKPQISDDNDGVEFDKLEITKSNDNRNILFNDLENALDISTNSEIGGYITLWLSDRDAKDWKDSINLPILVNGEEPAKDKVKGYKIKLGKNRVKFILPKLELNPELKEEERVLRVRFALDEEDILKSTGMAKTGEVEDYKVVIKDGMDIKFGTFEDTTEYKLEDLGIPCEEHKEKSLGDRDGYFAPNEVVEHTITVRNLTNTEQRDKEFYLNSNLLNLLLNEDKVVYEVVTPKENGSIESIENGKISLLTLDETNKYSYRVKIKEIAPRKDITLKIKLRIDGESFRKLGEVQKSVIEDRIVFNGVEPDAQDYGKRINLQVMEQDYGNNFVGSYDATTDARHYITSGMTRATWTHPAILGNIITAEDGPVNSDDNDGVEFSTNIDEKGNKINILYNNLTNEIVVKPTHSGYISVWLSDKDAKDWKNSKKLNIRLTPKGDINTFAETGNTLEIESGVIEKYPNGVHISFDLGEELEDKATPEDRIIRVRYSPISDKEVENPTGMATAGEVEDYKVTIISGVTVKFGSEIETEKDYKPEDLGIIYNYNSEENGMPNVAIYGDKDGNISPKEIIEHKITILNKTNSVQRNLWLIYNSNIAGEFVELVEEKVGKGEVQGKSEVSVEKALVIDGYQYKISVPHVPSSSYRTLTLRFKVTEENLKEGVKKGKETSDYKFYLKDRLIYENKIPEFKPYNEDNKVSLTLMNRDYAGNFVEVGKNDEATRHYLTTGDNGLFLGKEVKEEDKPQNSDDNDGVIFDKDSSNNNILYDGLNNKIKIKAKGNGFISAWVTEIKDTSIDNSDRLEFRDKDTQITTPTKLVLNGDSDVEFILPEYLVEANKNELEKAFIIRISADKNELEEKMAVTGEIEEHKVVIRQGLDAVFGMEKDEDYYPVDLGFMTSENKLVGEYDGNIVPGETVEHTVTIINKTNAVQSKYIYFETRLGEVLFDKVEEYGNNYFEMLTKDTGNISSIEMDRSYGDITRYKVYFENLKENSAMSFKFRMKVTESSNKENKVNRNDYKLYEKEEFKVKDRLIAGQYIPDFDNRAQILERRVSHGLMERDYSNKDSEDTVIHFRAGIIDPKTKIVSKLYKLGDKISIENEIKPDDDTDGIMLVNGKEPKVDEDNANEKIVQITRGQENKIKVKTSQEGYISFWLTGNNRGKDNFDWVRIGDVHKVTQQEQELTIDPNDLEKALSGIILLRKDEPLDFRYLRVRYSADKDEIMNATGYARSGEVEEYKVHMKNVTGTKVSKEQGGDREVIAGERVTYTLKFTNATQGIINDVVVEDDLTSVLSPNGKNVAKLDKGSIRVVEGLENVSGKDDNVKFTVTDTNIKAEVAKFDKKYLEIEFDIVINNPVEVKQKTELPNSVTVTESGASQEIHDPEPPILVPSEVKVEASKDYEAYRPDENGNIDYSKPLENYFAFDDHNEVNSEGRNKSVVVLPGDRVRYFVRIYNSGKDVAWSTLFVEDTEKWKEVYKVADFIEGSFKVVDSKGKDVTIYKPLNEISREEIKPQDVKPDAKNKIYAIIEKIEPKDYVMVTFDVKVKNESEITGIKYPHYLQNTALVKSNSDKNDDKNPDTQGPHLESLLKSKKISFDESGDRLIYPTEKFWYDIEVENYSAQDVSGIIVEDDLSYMKKFAKIESMTLKIFKEKTENPYKEISIDPGIVGSDGKLKYQLEDTLHAKEKFILNITFRANDTFENTGIDEDKRFYNTALIEQKAFVTEEIIDKGLGFDVTIRVEKEALDTKPKEDNGNSKWTSPENNVLEPYEELEYTIKLFNPSTKEKVVNFKDYLTELVKDKDKKEKNIELFDTVDFIDKSIEVSGAGAISNTLKYNKENKDISGDIKIKANGNVTVKFRVKLKVPLTNGLEAGDYLVNKVEAKDNITNKTNEAFAEIPIDYRIQVELSSRVLETMSGQEVENNPKKIVETGQTIEYKFTFINPFNKEVEVQGLNHLAKQKNEVVEILGNIPHYTDMNLKENEKPKIIYHEEQKVDESKNSISAFVETQKLFKDNEKVLKSVGIKGKLILPPMLKDKEGTGVTEVIFKVKVYDELPQDVEDAIEEAIENKFEGANLEEDAVPVHNMGQFIESRHVKGSENKILRTLQSRYTYNESDIINAKDPEPPYLVAIEKDEVIKISKQANKEQVSVGDLVAYELEIENTKDSGGGLTEIHVWDKLPPGFRYVKGTARLYRKNETGKYVKQKVEPEFSGKQMKFIIPKLRGKENLKITYILRVGTGVSPNVYENIAYVANKKDKKISNTARALVEVVLDRLFDMSTVIGKVFHDRDGDGWQDDANAYDVRIKTLTFKDNYEDVDGWYVNTYNYYWYYTKIKNGKVGDIDGRELETDSVSKVILRRRVRNPYKISTLEITTGNGLVLTMTPDGKVNKVEKGILKRGESGEKLRVARKIIEVSGFYYEQVELYNLGIHEEGIPGVKLSTLDGLIVTTDKFGRYHIEDIPIESVRGNNFIVKVDPVTLPYGSKFTTPNPLLKRIGHVMQKYNFGVKYLTDD